LIVLDNSDASADATIPGRCWPGLADWLAGSREYFSLSSFPFISPLSLYHSFSLSLYSCHFANITPLPALSFIVQPFPLFSRFSVFSSVLTVTLRYIRVYALSIYRFISVNDATFSSLFSSLSSQYLSPLLALSGLSGVFPLPSVLRLSLSPVLSISRYSVSRIAAILKIEGSTSRLR